MSDDAAKSISVGRFRHAAAKPRRALADGRPVSPSASTRLTRAAPSIIRLTRPGPSLFIRTGRESPSDRLHSIMLGAAACLTLASDSVPSFNLKLEHCHQPLPRPRSHTARRWAKSGLTQPSSCSLVSSGRQDAPLYFHPPSCSSTVGTIVCLLCMALQW